MASHDYIKDDGAFFEIVPSQRKVVVPTSHKVIGVVRKLSAILPTMV